MRVSKVLLTCAAASMMAMPVAASAATANPAAKLSISNSVPASARIASKRGKSKAIETGVVVAVAAVIAIGLGIYVAVDGDSKSDSR